MTHNDSRSFAFWGARVGLLMFGVLVFVVLAEIGLRIFQPEATGGGDEKQGYSLLEIAKPNLDGLFLGIPFRTNSLGNRGPEFSPTPGPGVFRILFAGDSVTMGWRVAEREAYPILVEHELNEASSGLHYESVNVGLAGVSTDGSMNRLEANAAAYSPDLLVYGFTLNDIGGPAYRAGYPLIVLVKLVRRHKRYNDSPSYLMRFVWPRLSRAAERLRPTLPSYSQELHDNYFENPEAWHAVEVGFDRFAALARDRGICAHLLVHTELADLDPEEHDYLDIYDAIEAAARERGITVSQSFPFFQGRSYEALEVAFLDPHPNAEGHILLAQALLAGIRDLAPSCLTKRSETTVGFP